MGYKFKPTKGVGKRMRITKTGKMKHRHEKNSHHRSGRSSGLKRRLGRPAILHEGHARNMRRFMGIVGRRPEQIRHEREMAALEKENGQAEAETTATKAKPQAKKPVEATEKKPARKTASKKAASAKSE